MSTTEEPAVDPARAQYEAIYGQVWNTREMTTEFSVEAFCAPYVVVVRKADNVRGTLAFTHQPRFYFSFIQGG